MEISHFCKSGGADGADTVFGNAACKSGHFVIHYAFAGMATKCKENDLTKIMRLTTIELLEGDRALRQAQKTLVDAKGKRRWYPCSSVYVNNLLRRNYYQIKETDTVYAVSRLVEGDEHVEGGTGWAVEMAIHKKIKDIFVFDTNKGNWYNYSYNLNKFIPTYSIPRPSGIYTGIGSRELPENGKLAIEKLYNG